MRFDSLQPILDEKMKFIYKYLIKIGANPRDAEDILQETVYKFIIHIESIDPQKASSWIFRVALNQYYDLCRKQKKQVTVSIEGNEFADTGLLPEYVAIDNERKRSIDKTLNQMKPLYKNLLVLKYLVGMSYDEISTNLEINPGTTKTYLYRAREQFKSLYGRESDE
ncbi:MULTISPECIES: RNA polymerase sigma factor [Bacillota]|uniref:RNA polymerase sigma factor n=1 Tax=Bacillota TaxID=1239 RepID=UPI0039EFA672